MGGFTKLHVWEKAKQLSITVYQITNNSSFSKDYSLRDQIRRSAVSIPSNIAKGSSAELRTQLVIAKEFEVMINEAITISKMLSKLIKSKR